MIITIDGPTASGKSTAALALAKKLGIAYLNSGLLYRACAFLLMENYGYSLKQLEHPDKHAVEMCLDPQRLAYNYDNATARVHFDKRDITPHLKNPLVDQAASIVSTCKIVRQALLEFQRRFGQNNDMIIDGRDAGSVVFPHADYKFFLTASPEIRAHRWRHDQPERGNKSTGQEALKQIAERDHRDTNRAIAPLRIPDGAIFIDNSDLTSDQTIETLYKHIKRNN